MRRLMRKPTTPSDLYADSDLSDRDCAHLAQVMQSAQRVFDDRQLLFIFGVMPRSGTNFLYELLLTIPPFARPPIDFAELPILAAEEYFEGPTELIGRVHPESAEAFGRMEWMAYAVAGFRNRLLDMATPGSVTLIKNPVVWNIELWPVLFPQDRTVFIMRDARYIVDSFLRTFARKRMSRTFEDICIETAHAMAKSRAFVEAQPADKLMLIRYEEAVREKDRTASAIMDWMGLDRSAMDHTAIDQLPIYGSSTHSQAAGGAVDWTPVQADASFDPTSRPLQWTAAQKAQFERICGPLNAEAGYPSSP